MLDIIAAHWELGFAGAALIMMRILMVPLLLYNMGWSISGFKDLIKGQPFPTAIYQTVVFLMSGGVMGYHALTFLGRTVSEWTVPWSLALHCVLMLGSIAATIGRHLAITVNFEKFYWLFSEGNLDVAVRAARISEANPEFAEAMLTGAESTVAVQLAKKAAEDVSG